MSTDLGKPGVIDESVESLAARLHREIEQRDDLLSLTTHELRNPLHALSLQLALARSTARSHRQADTEARIAKAQATLTRYIDRVTVLLELACGTSNTYPLRKKPVNLSAVLAALAEGLDAEAQFHGVRLVTDMPAALTALADPLAIEQIVENLLLNAFKHAACTTVTLRLRATEDGWVQIEVADDGKGLRDQDRQRVMGMLQPTGDATAARDASSHGTGLGLWIVRKLLHVMGGGVSLSSQPGAGCVFTASFPLSESNEQTP